jgi:hypothetical protein
LSTKIYSGFIVRGASTQEALTILGRERPAIQALVDSKSHAELIRRVVADIDGYTLARHLYPNDDLSERYPDAQTRSAWWPVVESLRTEQATCRGGNAREPLVDCDVELTVYLQPSSGHLMGYVQEERIGAYNHLMTVPGISEYGYWNNTDPLEGVSDEDWDLRGAAWDEVLDAKDAVRFSMTWQPSFIDRRNLLAKFPDLQYRAKKLARNFVINRVTRENQTAETERGSLSGLMRVLRTTEEALQDETSALYAEYLAALERFTPWLAPNIEAHLFTNLAQLPGLPEKTEQ